MSTVAISTPSIERDLNVRSIKIEIEKYKARISAHANTLANKICDQEKHALFIPIVSLNPV